MKKTNIQIIDTLNHGLKVKKFSWKEYTPGHFILFYFFFGGVISYSFSLLIYIVPGTMEQEQKHDMRKFILYQFFDIQIAPHGLLFVQTV